MQIFDVIKNIFGILLLFLWAIFITLLGYWPVIALFGIISLCLCFWTITAGIIFASIIFCLMILVFIFKMISY